MLEKQRNTLIKKAFETAKIIAPGTELTALEIDDAAYTLNCMLQGWSNEGFRLFNMKTGYMPLLPKKNEYKLSTEAYSMFSTVKLESVESIGATKVKVLSIKDMAPSQSILFLNNTFSKRNRISSIDYVNTVLSLEEPVDINLYSGDDVFFGNITIASTEVKQYPSSFSSIVLTDSPQLPAVGDYMYLNFSGSWTKVSVTNVAASTNTVYFATPLGAGRISKPQVVYGSSIGKTTLQEGVDVLPRKLNTSSFVFVPNTVSVISDCSGDSSIKVESVFDTGIILEKPISSSVLSLIGKSYVEGDEIYPVSSLLKWNQIPQDILNHVIDWGSVADIPASSSVSWGYVSDVVSGKEDFGTLTGSAKITGFAQSGNDTYVSVNTDSEGYVLHKDASGEWAPVEEAVDAKLFTHNGQAYLYNIEGGLYRLRGQELDSTYSGFVVEYIIEFSGLYYLVSSSDNGRLVVSTKDFLVFSEPYQIDNIDFSNATEFKGKLYCGKEKTFVSSNMKTFYDAQVYAENRAVIGDVLQNFNASEVCSYSVDGVKFMPMPATTANVPKATLVHGCSFVSVYGSIARDGSMGSRVFSVNEFHDKWTEQTVISGKVFDMYEDNGNLIVVSDTEVQAIKLSIDSKTEDVDLYLFGRPIGRPQELMNVVKYGLKSEVQLTMEEMALKDYSQLPHIKADGDPVSYCFFRDAKDGTMMVWGTPKKFGEYLKFTYVEPIALLDNAKSVPDIPDEYVGAVIDGLAAQLAYEYALPSDKVQVLEAKAEASKQMALLHDNENSSYVIEPNRRGL